MSILRSLRSKLTLQPAHLPAASERQLRDSLERYQRIFRVSHGYGFLDWDIEARRMYWHGGFWARLGYGDADLAKLSDPDHFLDYVHADDRKQVNDDVRAIFLEDSNSDLTFRIRTKDGGHIWAEVRTGTVRDGRGWVTHLSGVVLDVTEQKETEQALLVSEARHARIIKSSNDGIWEWTAEEGGTRLRKSQSGSGLEWTSGVGGFNFSNRCWELLGYTEGDDMLTGGGDRLHSWRSLMHEDDAKRFDKALYDHITKREPFDIEYRMRGKDGNWRWIRGRGFMSYNAAGQPSVMSGTNMDITELKLAEERVMKAKEDAEKANRAKSEFLSSMSHELRTPLNAILGFAQLFELDGNLNVDQKDNVREIKLAGRHLLELIGDVLDLAKIEAGHMDFSMEKLLPIHLVKESLTLLRAQIADRNLTLNTIYRGLENCAISADFMRLKQVLLNLISNAIKYNCEAGRIDIECELCDDSHLKISVKDTGQGIAQHLQRNVFQPFNRLGAELSEVEGSGVGLVITKQLVEQMGGSIGFASEQGVGSTFWVIFPLYRENRVSLPRAVEGAAAQRARIASAEESTEIPELLVREPKNILYVEDNPANQKLMKQLLVKYAQLNLKVVGQAVQGLYAARSTIPDLIVLDINLPGMSGLEMVAILKQDPATRHIPTIALSANVMMHDITKGEQAGFDAYLTKPVHLGELIASFNRYLV